MRRPRVGTQKKGDDYIQAAYEHLLEHGTATGDQLVVASGSHKQMFGRSQCHRMNEYMSFMDKPHRFYVTPGVPGRKGKPSMWYLRKLDVT